jgi:hypothetical protein
MKFASNFATFFDKLTRIIEKLALLLPQYKDVYAAIRKAPRPVSQRLRESLISFYSVLFELFEAVARVFSKPDGSKSLGNSGAVPTNVSQK